MSGSVGTSIRLYASHLVSCETSGNPQPVSSLNVEHKRNKISVQSNVFQSSGYMAHSGHSIGLSAASIQQMVNAAQGGWSLSATRSDSGQYVNPVMGVSVATLLV